MDLTSVIIKANAPMGIDAIVEQLYKEWLASQDYKDMLTANDYYRNKNDIMDKVKTYVCDGETRTATGMANNKVAHPIVRDLVDQKVQYLLSADWSVETENATWQDFLTNYYSDAFRTQLVRVSRDAILKGIGWLYVWIEEGKLKTKRMLPEEVIPVWADQDHTELDAVIRFYSTTEYVSTTPKIITYVEYWDETGVRYYKSVDGSKLKFEGENGHMEDAEGNPFLWSKLPFIPFKYNDDEVMLIQVIKSLVDDYDSKKSSMSDLLDDETNKFKVVKGYESTDPREFVRNMNTFRVAFIDDGDITELGSAPDVTGTIAYLEKTRQDIFDFGRGVDTNASMGANASGDARQYLYAKLDLDCNDLEKGIVNGLQELSWFICNSIPNLAAFIDEKVNYMFSRNTIINEGMMLDNAIKMQSIDGISMKTIVNYVPSIENADEEIEKWEDEQGESMTFALDPTENNEEEVDEQ